MNQEHISRQFDADLEGLRTRVLAMGGLVEQQLIRAMDGLESGDMALLEQVITNDRLVNRHEVELDEACNHVIARRQPAAVDLRMIMTVVKTITDLERIGDEAKKIGFKAAMRQLITFMMEDPRPISSSLDLLFVARAIERVGDHAKNISEYVVYLVKGRDVRHIGLAAMEKEVARQPGNL